MMPHDIALRCKEITNFTIKTKLIKDQKAQAKIMKQQSNKCYAYKRCHKLGIIIPGAVVAVILIILALIPEPIMKDRIDYDAIYRETTETKDAKCLMNVECLLEKKKQLYYEEEKKTDKFGLKALQKKHSDYEKE